MKKTFFKNLFRDIKGTFSRFLSIVIIIAVGVAFYTGVRTTSPDMKMSGDAYFNKNSLMDFKLISTLGLTQEDVTKLSKVTGVASVEGTYSLDAVVEKDKQSLVLNINSQPKENGINKLKIVSGRKAENNNEAVVEDRFLKSDNLKIGDKITLLSGDTSNILDSLTGNEFTIVGIAESPLYVSAQRQLSAVGNGTVRGFVYILPQAFKSKVYTEAYVRTNNPESASSLLYNEDYNRAVSGVKNSLKDIGATIGASRYNEILKMTNGKIRDIKKPSWYVLGRTENVGYESYRQDSDRIDNIGKVFPFIFFLVAALVSLTTMTRMVQENRIEIGTFKALGYSRISIVAHYLIYSLTASVMGSIIGLALGFRLFPPLIMTAYGSLYAVPDTINAFNISISLQAALIAILFTTVAAVAATIEELREVPASLLRPKPPKLGKNILLEKITFIWKRMSFTRKVTARNIFRYKQRLLMTVIGIGACTGLMITGFGLKAGIIGATENQFNNIYKYDMIVTFTKNIDTPEVKDLKDKLKPNSNIKSLLFSYTKNSSISKDSATSQDAYIVVPEDKEALNNYVKLTQNGNQLKLNDDGVIITEKLSKLINKKIGDTIEITINEKKVSVKISAITEQYIQHYIYMSPKYYKKVTGETVTFNSIYGLIKNTSESSENNTSKDLKTISSINYVSFKNNTKLDSNKSVNSINKVVIILIASAGVLAFVVIYNLTNININERKRELATIKLLGFYNNELASYIYRENMIFTIMGSIFGIFIGVFLNTFVISTAETNVMMFLKTINPIYFLYSIALTIVFSLVVNLAMYNKFDKIDLIESLKSPE